MSFMDVHTGLFAPGGTSRPVLSCPRLVGGSSIAAPGESQAAVNTKSDRCQYAVSVDSGVCQTGDKRELTR
jgi:hypothetical protein